MKSFTVYGNCQTQPLANILQENKSFSEIYRYIPIKPAQTLGKDDYKPILSKIESIDLFIHQPVATTNNRPKELSSDHLLKKLKSNALRISFPSIYFDGYFPHLQAFKGLVSELNLVHDYFIAYLFAKGYSEKHTFEAINDSNLYTPNTSKQLVSNSLNNLTAREASEDLDIRISRYIEKNYRKQKLFNQFNHPRRPVFRYIAENILKTIKIQDTFIPETGATTLDGIITPIYQSTYNNLKLEFPEDFHHYRSQNHDRIHQNDIISCLFRFYRTLDSKMIEEHVKKSKPFISEAIDGLQSHI
ncbi:WcbI family polysaccharide biosynthesis putative acetyltransferase [Microbulbifer sp. EKSA008]|uniref:WcbI family polysaccharide biosynthesis putative acetyltransferase n=1 Tax=Microbulbifer sp. EKSA008 TaxID=3243367 RepID=UPI004041439E